MGMRELRTARIEFRITPREKAALECIAKKKRRTVTSLFDEWIETLTEQECPAKS
jgi:uncharacterized protein (DUF1778 family)